MMKKIMLKVLPVSLLCTVLFLLGLTPCCLANDPFYPEAEKYLRHALPVIVQHWDLKDLQKFSGQQFSEELNGYGKQSFRTLFKQCANRLGKLKHLDTSSIDPIGNTLISSFPDPSPMSAYSSSITRKGKVPKFPPNVYQSIDIYECSTPAIFEKGKVTIQTSIRTTQGRGNIDSFKVVF